MRRISSCIALLALVACVAPEEVADLEDTTVDGIVFKGPLVAGSSMTLQPVDSALQPVGDAVSAEVDVDSGRYEAMVLQHQGLVRISVQGALYDEAARGRVDVPTELSAYAVLGGSTEALHLNVLGDLSRSRVENLVAQGSSAADAISQAEEELVSALDLGGVTPQRSGAALDVYTDSTDASWLLAASAVLSQAGAERGDREALMADLRDDLADDGSFVDGLTDEVDAAIPTVDPAHTTDRLRVYLEALGIDETLPDPNPALDSDGDGVDNSTDVCPYVADPDQETTAGGWGVACDSRMTTIEASGTFACGLLVNGGELTCWDLAAESPGGQPPRPDNAPTAQYGPWLDQPGLTGSFTALSVGPGVVCGADTTEVRCWVDHSDTLLSIPGAVVDVDTSTELICTLDAAGAMACYDHDGTELWTLAAPWSKIETVGASDVCGLEQPSGVLFCFDAAGAASVIPDLPTVSLIDFSGTDEGEPAGVGVDANNQIVTFGDDFFFNSSDEALSIFAGNGVFAFELFPGAFSTLWSPVICPGVDAAGEQGPEPEGQLFVTTVGTCLYCGLDEDGFGWCLPTVDYR